MTIGPVPVIPQPVRYEELTERPVELGAPIRISLPPELLGEGRFLRRSLESGTGRNVELVAPGENATVVLRLGYRAPQSYSSGAYELSSGNGIVTISGDTPAGVFYGVQTLRQLLPPSTLRAAGSGGTGPGGLVVPPVRVVDWPRFSWRGVHLDVCRHFMPKSFLLKMIDLAAFHKCNIFHLHLTEDQGWRIPIDRYPRLVEIGAWRRESASGHEGEGGFDGVPHGGYYTKDDLREVVAFAAERHVTVVPEVDMPGHMTAAIASYPELGNTGRQLEVATGWGVFDHILNLEESTIEFCTDVIEEVLELFPGPYFHAGGDECPTVEWEANGRARRLMEEHEMDDARQLQAWFTARIAAHVEKRGRTLVGWHEILLGGAPPSAVVAAWREEGVGAALAAGHDVVMAPENWLYFDWAYSNDPAEPLAIRGAIPVERVYSYDPAPISLPEDARERVLGTQCQLWTEYVPTPRHAEYMYFPRLCALAEVAWSPSRADGSARSYEEFERRLDRHLERLAALDVNYRPLSGPTPGQARLWRAPY